MSAPRRRKPSKRVGLLVRADLHEAIRQAGNGLATVYRIHDTQGRISIANPESIPIGSILGRLDPSSMLVGVMPDQAVATDKDPP